MKTTKSFKNCSETGKVCRKVYNYCSELAFILSKSESLEEDENTIDAGIYAILHQAVISRKSKITDKIDKACIACVANQVGLAKQRLNEANEAVYLAVKESREASITVLNRILEGNDEEQLKNYDLHALWEEARLTDAACIATEQAVQDTYTARYEANTVLKDRMELLDRFYSQGVALLGR
jgi:hypothetical protein